MQLKSRARCADIGMTGGWSVNVMKTIYGKIGAVVIALLLVFDPVMAKAYLVQFTREKGPKISFRQILRTYGSERKNIFASVADLIYKEEGPQVHGAIYSELLSKNGRRYFQGAVCVDAKLILPRVQLMASATNGQVYALGAFGAQRNQVMDSSCNGKLYYGFTVPISKKWRSYQGLQVRALAVYSNGEKFENLELSRVGDVRLPSFGHSQPVLADNKKNQREIASVAFEQRVEPSVTNKDYIKTKNGKISTYGMSNPEKIALESMLREDPDAQIFDLTN
jgi:hypothetical protein